MKRSNIDQLIEAYVEGTASEKERRWLELHYLEYLDKECQAPSRAQLDRSFVRVYPKLMDAINPKPIVIKRSKWRRLLPYAAAVLLLCGLFVLLNRKSDPSTLSQVSHVEEIITPGGNKATLSIEGGETLVLDEMQEGIVMEGNGITYKDGSSILTETTPTKNYTLQTPKGGTYELQFADGTKVWLNADSRISYANNLGSTAVREIQLEGEAYFEVSKDKERPFVVKTAKEIVEVLGTHFNINAYQDEVLSRTTLLEGSVRINTKTILRPGQQAIVSPDGRLRKKEVDAEKVIAWKKGRFVFESEDLHSVLQKIGRWYDVEVSYEYPVPNKTFSGTVSRFEDLQQILNVISYTSNVKFKTEGRRIVVMP